MAYEDTGFGVPADKTIKNIFGSSTVYEYIKDMKTTGVIEEDDKLGVTTIAVPMGVIAGIIPSIYSLSPMMAFYHHILLTMNFYYSLLF